MAIDGRSETRSMLGSMNSSRWISCMAYSLLVPFMLSMSVLAGDRAEVSRMSLEIVNPINADSVEWRTKVTGRALQSFSEVWVVVRPLETRNFWVQPKTTMHANGDWETVIYLGGKGNSHVGKVFDLRAIANPVDSLKEGLVFPGWPRAEVKSEIVRVARR